ncbi:uncharacterized protein LOC144616840 [Panthera onca]
MLTALKGVLSKNGFNFKMLHFKAILVSEEDTKGVSPWPLGVASSQAKDETHLDIPLTPDGIVGKNGRSQQKVTFVTQASSPGSLRWCLATRGRRKDKTAGCLM